jgi:hypothetical protein
LKPLKSDGFAAGGNSPRISSNLCSSVFLCGFNYMVPPESVSINHGGVIRQPAFSLISALFGWERGGGTLPGNG